MPPFAKLFLNYTYNICDNCCRDSFHEMHYDDESNEYQCCDCCNTIPASEGFEEFDYRSFTEDIRKLDEVEAKKSIIRYMRWLEASDDAVYDKERIDFYYQELLKEPPGPTQWTAHPRYYLLFQHYEAGKGM